MPTLEEIIKCQEELLVNLKSGEKHFKNSPKERIKRPYLETRLEVLEQQFRDFKNGHKAVISNTSKERSESYFTRNKYEEFEEFYIQYKTALLEALEQCSTTQTSMPTAETENGYCNVELPRINLPTFSGKYEEWQTFYDMFSSLIHNNKNITSVQKLHYLKSNLSGEAQNLLHNFSTTEANYEEAWGQLVRRYNNKRYNCNAILSNLFATKKIHVESANAVRYLLDTTSNSLKSLQNMGVDTSSWDAIIVFIVISRLDTESMRQWELHLNTLGDELPTWEQLQDYLEHRIRSLEMVDTNASRPTQPAIIKPIVRAKTFLTTTESKNKTSDVECAMCHENHYIYHCKQFGLMTPKERQSLVQNNGLCFNCLSPTHSAVKCGQSLSCRKCARRHHSLLHFEQEKKREDNQETIAAKEVVVPSSTREPAHEKPSTSRGADTHFTAVFWRNMLQPNSVLLPTARIKVFNSTGCKQTIRALLDQGSQASFVTENTVQFLGLTRKAVSGFVSGLGDSRMRIKYTVSLRVESRHNPANSIHVNAYVLHSLTSLLPTTKLSVPEWTDIGNLPLADPTYTTPGKIDILLGADVYGDILLDGMMKQSEGSLMAQNTIFGWILSGRASSEPKAELKSIFTSLHVQLKENEILKKFWEMENEPNMIQKEMKKSEKQCEDFFHSATVRNYHSRLIVRLPFTIDDTKSQYGHSKEIAIKRLDILERKLLREPKIREELWKNI